MQLIQARIHNFVRYHFYSQGVKPLAKKILAKIRKKQPKTRKQQPKTTEKYRSLKALAEQIDFKR